MQKAKCKRLRLIRGPASLDSDGTLAKAKAEAEAEAKVEAEAEAEAEAEEDNSQEVEDNPQSRPKAGQPQAGVIRNP